MHLQANNKSLCYRQRACLLKMTEKEKNLGILASHRITTNYQSNVVSKKDIVNMSNIFSRDMEKKIMPLNKWIEGQMEY